MGKIVVSTNVTLDGVSEDPDGQEGFRFGGWFLQVSEADREGWAKTEFEEALGTDALLLGGRSYAWFAARWAGREGAWAERLAALPKYVVRSAAGRVDWGPTTVVEGDLAAAVSTLKATVPGDVVVYGSGQLVSALLGHDLVDEVRLFVFPHVLGSGGRPFAGLPAGRALRLSTVQTVGDGLVRLVYQAAAAAAG